MTEYLKTLVITYAIFVGALWGLIEGTTYFKHDALKKFLGPYWWLVLYALPVFIAAGVAGDKNGREAAAALGAHVYVFWYVPPAVILLCLLAASLFVWSRSKASNLAVGQAAVHLRGKPTSLSPADLARVVETMGFNHPEDMSTYKLSRGVVGGTFQHRYEPQAHGDDMVVIDGATDLMWQRSGSRFKMSWQEAGSYVGDLNERRFAGYGDWRLPTVEELASLLEPIKKGDLYVAELFTPKQSWCWSADAVSGSRSAAWFVDFVNGLVDSIDMNVNLYVRAVRPHAPGRR